MKLSLSTALPLLLLPFSALAAKKASSDRFVAARAKSFPVKLDDSKFSKLTAGPRDFGSAILLTALEAKFGCGACREFQPEWELLSKSWYKGDKGGESRTVFATLDFVDGKATFQSVGVRYSMRTNFI
jgi:oligosaccharyltransferase complex subunit gamma